MPKHHRNGWAQLRIPRDFTWLALTFPSLVLAGQPSATVKTVTILGSRAPVNLATQAGQPYDARAIEKDVRALWSTGRFSDIRVEAAQDGDGTAVFFRVVEAPALRLRQIRIEPSSFSLHPVLGEGTPINPLRAHQIALEARKKLNAEGYTNAQVYDRLLPVSRDQVDLRLSVDAGRAVDVKQVEFRGEPDLEVKELHKALRSTQIRRVSPRILGLWNGWTLSPAYSPEAVEAGLGRLRSFYLAKGYFDASIRLDKVEIHDRAARVTINVQAGPRYRVREWNITGPGMANASGHADDAVQSAAGLCANLMATRRNAERLGMLDFFVKLDIQQINAARVADLTAVVDEAMPYRVGRIEFTGNHRYKDDTVRRNFLLDEGQPFDRQLLRKSIARLNQSMLFEAVDESAIEIRRHPESGLADIAIRLTERKPRAWAISGPVGPVSFAGPLQGSLSSRLPPWGRGLLELSTYTASISLLAFAHPLIPLLSISSRGRFLPVFALQRPFMAGEGWKSGFILAPGIGWRLSAASYASTQMRERLLPTLIGDRNVSPALSVTLARPQGDVVLLCEPSKPRFASLRSSVAIALRLLSALPTL